MSSLLLRGLLLAATAAAAGYQVAALLATRRYRRAVPPLADEEAPQVTLLKPVRGQGPEATGNFRSFCRQNYPEYEVLFGALDVADPALCEARRVAMEPGAAHTVLLGSPRKHGANPEVSNLLNLFPLARHDLILISESNVRVAPDFLRRVLAPFRDPRVGLVSCPYRGAQILSLADHLEALDILTSFIPGVLVAERRGSMRVAPHSVIAVRREALRSVGGLERVADSLAYENDLGRRVQEAGWEVVLAPTVVEKVLGRQSLAVSWARRLHRARRMRARRLGSNLRSGITHATPIALLAFALGGGSVAVRAAVCATLLVRLAAARGAAAALGAPLTPLHWLLLPASDLLSLGLWCAGLRGRRVKWHREGYHISPDGRPAELETETTRNS